MPKRTSEGKVTSQKLETRLAQAETIIGPLHSIEVDTIISQKNDPLAHLRETGKEVQEYRQSLERMVRKRTIALEKVNAELRREIAERVQTEEALRVSRDAIDSSVAGVIITGLEGKIRYTNPAFLGMFGYKDNETVIDEHATDLFPSERVQKFADVTAIIDRMKGETEEFLARRQDGVTLHVEVSSSIITDREGNDVGRMASFVDITERKEAEETLRKRNRELVLLNRVGQELTATLNLQQVVGRLLPATTEIIGAEGASIWLLDEEREDELVCQALFHSGQRIIPRDMRMPLNQGIAGWVAETGESVIVPSTSNNPRFFSGFDQQIGHPTRSLLAAPLRAHYKIIGVLEVVNKLEGDFSEHDLALVEMLGSAAAIALDNARLIETQRRHSAELEARNKELDAYAHTVAHDLKGPLSSIVGFAQVLEEDYATLPDEELRRYLHTIAQSGRKASNIVDELLLLSSVRKIEEVNLSPLDMGGIVAEAQQRLVDKIEKHQAEILLPKAWPVVPGYGPWIEEVWVNYLDNALKYGGKPEEGIPPRIELGFDKWTNEQMTNDEPSIRFWVRDNGLALTSEQQTRLFRAFERSGLKGERIHPKGHGLGLSIVRRIVEKLDGQVGVESEIGQGSLFWFTLPAARQTA
ncbi:MAG: PAS domain S-box protein [Chloroflexota bacterium]|nr:PAS domain S-box protein [Chloroflexota bacterium]